MRCPHCHAKLKQLGERDVVSVALGSMTALGDLYRCKRRHVWVAVDPPVMMDQGPCPEQGCVVAWPHVGWHRNAAGQRWPWVHPADAPQTWPDPGDYETRPPTLGG